MTTTASDKPAPAEEEKGAEQGFWRRISNALLFWRRIPTALLVTFVGIALSAWLLPAITRQWDDRQKARALQAEIADEVAVAGAETSQDLLRLVDSARRPGSVSRVQERWLSRRIRIEARLAAYYRPHEPVRTDWTRFARAVNDMIKIATLSGDPRIHPGKRNRQLRHAVRKDRNLVSKASHTSNKTKNFGFEHQPSAFLALGKWANDGIRQNTLIFMRIISTEVEMDNPRGFSVTRGDLLHDLKP